MRNLARMGASFFERCTTHIGRVCDVTSGRSLVVPSNTSVQLEDFLIQHKKSSRATSRCSKHNPKEVVSDMFFVSGESLCARASTQAVDSVVQEYASVGQISWRENVAAQWHTMNKRAMSVTQPILGSWRWQSAGERDRK